MGKVACVVAAFGGFTFGGLLNILLLAGAADDRLEAHGINTFFSAVKPLGEGHEIGRPENPQTLYTRLAAFFAESFSE
ncbi:MAG TPA: hypothetical protein VIL85_27835 [Thermomicrobiales bacterium]|jgi:hypothetical protein